MKLKSTNKCFLIILVSLILIVIFSFIFYNHFNKSSLIKLDINDIIEKIENKDSFVLCISSTECSHCASYKPKLDKISKQYDLDIFYIDVNIYSKEELDNLKNYISIDKSTPVTAFIIDGKETTVGNRIIGNAKLEKIIEKLKINGFISENKEK